MSISSYDVSPWVRTISQAVQDHGKSVGSGLTSIGSGLHALAQAQQANAEATVRAAKIREGVDYEV